MTEVLLSIEPALLAVTLAAWTWVAVRAGTLAAPGTPRQLQRRCGRLLAGVSIGVGALLSWVVLLAGLRGSGSGSPVTALPLLAALAVLVMTVPRMVAVRRAALTLSGIGAMSPALRQQAAHPLLVWPLQVTALGVAAAGLVRYVAALPLAAGTSLAALFAVGLAALFGWRRLARRHRHLGGDVVVPWRRSRRPVWAPSTMEGHLLNSSR
ncbi:MAG TPA: hypothetical protein VK028_13545 [Micromonosporaceae bacterium]|nr:hypothetical protein [Micromonosporaceae bacterium]